MLILRIDEWDAVSKQPRFKSGAVRIEKIVQREGGKENHAKEQDTAAIKRAEEKAMQRAKPDTDQPRVRRLELWLGATYEGIESLSDIYTNLIPRLIHDFEVHSGLQSLLRITDDMLNRLRPMVKRYHESEQYGRNVCHGLRDAIFPKPESHGDPYEVLAALQSLQLFVTYIHGHLTALAPASQALWDSEFVDAVIFCENQLSRQEAWLAQKIKVKSPQSLLVPMAVPEELCVEGFSMGGRLRRNQLPR